MIPIVARPYIALVHGIRITRSEEALEKIWLRHLSKGIPEISELADVDLIYWVGAAESHSGHPLVNLIRAMGDDLSNLILELKSTDAELNQHTESALATHPDGEEAERNFLKLMTTDFVHRSQKVIREGIEDGLIQVPGIPQPKGLWALANNSMRKLSRLLLDEIHAYLYSPHQREDIREAVWKQLEPQLIPGRPIALIGHSLGALIVLDLLETRAREGHPLDIDLVVTMGNPLGFPALYDRLPQPVQISAGIRRWVNLTAEHDLVVFPRPLSTLIHPCEESGIAVEDFTFVNDIGRWTWLDSFHLPEGYLQSGPLAEVLRDWLSASGAKQQEKSLSQPLADP